MFTGIVQCLGETLSVTRDGGECRFRFRPMKRMDNLIDGESIDVNGVCLSVEKHDPDTFQAYASGETLSCSNLGLLRIGSRVNLERALELGARLGGHLVSGHVDCVATVAFNKNAGQSRFVRFNFPEEYADEVIAKGSIALDGISLTVNNCGSNFLEVNLIPDTMKHTNINSWHPGTKVNMETDMIGKYVLKFMRMRVAGKSQGDGGRASGISRDFLERNGFF